MTAQQLQILIDTKDVQKIKDALESCKLVEDIECLIKQFNTDGHEVLDENLRKDKTIFDDKGNMSGKVKVARIPLAYQKNIVMVAAAFLGRPKLQYTATDNLQETFAETLNKILEDNKFDYKFMACVKKTKSERQCAFLCYNVAIQPGDDYWDDFQVAKKPVSKIKMRLLAKSLGDELYPAYDATGDMIAFGRAYEISDKVDGADIKMEYFELYTADKIYISNKSGSKFWETSEYINYVKKIPIAYFCQPITDFEDVKELIKRFETKVSNHADTNDYFDSPIVKAKGTVQGFSSKGESGKVLEMSEGADAEYLTYNSLPESMKLEMDNLKLFIELFSNTPDISFQNLKNLGYFSNMSMKVMFLAAHMKAYDSEEVFGEGSQRLFNYLKKNLVQIAPEFKLALKMTIKPVFTYFLPKNDQEEVQTIVQALGAGIISKKTAIKLNPLVDNVVNELELIMKEKEAAAALITPLPGQPPVNNKPVNNNIPKFNVGDSVMVIPGKEHMPEHKGINMTIYEINGNTYAVKLPDGSIHKWYTGDELMSMIKGNNPDHNKNNM